MSLIDWCFTINNYEENWENTLKGWPNIRYLIVQPEIANSGTDHLQGFLILQLKKSLYWMKKNLCVRGHFEARHHSRWLAMNYCRKPTFSVGPVLIVGEISFGQGKRSDLQAVVGLIRDDASIYQIATLYPTQYMRYHKGIHELASVLQNKSRAFKTETKIMWGVTGLGKSSDIETNYPEAFWLRRSNSGSIWFDGYNGQQVLVLDDFYGWLPIDRLLRMTDRFPLSIDTKGGHRAFLFEKMFITSNVHPSEWYKNVPSAVNDALMRRLDSVEHWTWLYDKEGIHKTEEKNPGGGLVMGNTDEKNYRLAITSLKQLPQDVPKTQCSK